MEAISDVKATMGHRVALMGNVPPLHVAVRQPPAVVAEFAKADLDRAASGGRMILSVGGGVSPDMPAESLDAMLVETARTWEPPTTTLKIPPGVGRGLRSVGRGLPTDALCGGGQETLPNGEENRSVAKSNHALRQAQDEAP